MPCTCFVIMLETAFLIVMSDYPHNRTSSEMRFSACHTQYIAYRQQVVFRNFLYI